MRVAIADGSKWTQKDMEKIKFVYNPPSMPELMLQHHAGLLGRDNTRRKLKLPVNP